MPHFLKKRRICTFVFLFFSIRLINAAPIRGTSGDLWADQVFDQVDFTQNTYNHAVSHSSFYPHSVVVDTSDPLHNRLYLNDVGNNRVLGFSDINGYTANQASSSSGHGADIVIGQNAFNLTGANGESTDQNYPALPTPSAYTLATQPLSEFSPGESGATANMAVDGQGNLYVPDFYNHRVLRYNKPAAGALGPAAVAVWGQVDFSQNLPNRGGSPTANSLQFYSSMYDENQSAGVAVDSHGCLWVADKYNARVLRFPNHSGSAWGIPDATADVVLGQPNFTTVAAVTSLTDLGHMAAPTAVRVASDGTVYVSDIPIDSANANNANCQMKYRGRVLVYKPTGTDTNGLPQYGTNNQGLPASTGITQYLGQPVGLELDPSTGGFWVTDFCMGQIPLFVNTSGLHFTCQKVLLTDTPKTVPQGCAASATGDGASFQDSFGNSMGSWASCQPIGAVGVDTSGKVYLGIFRSNDVFRFPVPIPTPYAGIAHSADMLLFKHKQLGLINQPDSESQASGKSVAMAYTTGVTQLIVSDQWKMMYWNVPSSGVTSIPMGTYADGFVGTTDCTIVENPHMGRISVDRLASPHVWALTSPDQVRTEIRLYNLPFTTNSYLGTHILLPPMSLVGGGTISTWPWDENGIVVARDGSFLWATDKQNNRVFRVRDPMTNPLIDIVLGQPNPTSSTINDPSGVPSQSNLAHPGAVALDHDEEGNLYISDYSLESDGNGRILQYDKEALRWTGSYPLYAGMVNPQTGVTLKASRVYGTSGSFTATGLYDARSLSACRPWGLSFSPDDKLMVVGQDGQQGHRYPVVLTDPKNGDNPVTNLKDFSSQTYSSTFDDDGNLYVIDHNWNRVLSYWGFAQIVFPTPVPYATPTRTPCTCPSVDQTYGTGTAGSALGQFNGVMAEMIGNGYLYVAEANNNRVQLLNLTTGATITSFSGIDSVRNPSGLISPYDATLSPDKTSLFVCAINGNRVVKLNALTGAVSAVFGTELDGPTAVSVDEKGDVYVADRWIVKKYHMQTNGSYTAVTTLGLGTRTGAINDFNVPMGVLAIGNNVYVADTRNNRVMRWTSLDGGSTYSNPQTVYAPGTSGTNPIKLAAESGSNRVHVVCTNGLWVVFDTTTTPWSLLYQCNLGGTLNGVAIDNGAMYTSVATNNTVTKRTILGSVCFAAITLPTNTPTPNVPFTPTVTFTSTPSSTYTVTATAPWTETPTPSLTATATSTDTSTPTASWTPTYSSTATSTASTTTTPTATTNKTCTDTWTPTASPSSSPTASWTPTSSSPATSTASATTTSTPTNSSTSTATKTCTDTWTSTASPSSTPTASWTPTYSSTATSTVSTTSTPTATPSPANRISPTYTPTPVCNGGSGMHQLVIYPNPLKNQTRFIIRGSLCNSGNRVRIKIFTLANRKIRETQWNSLPSGIFDLTMDAKDDKGSVLASGLYYVLIETYSGERKVLKLAIIH